MYRSTKFFEAGSIGSCGTGARTGPALDLKLISAPSATDRGLLRARSEKGRSPETHPDLDPKQPPSRSETRTPKLPALLF